MQAAISLLRWAASQQSLRDTYVRMRSVAANMVWQNDQQIAGAMGMIAHNAYHLGEIRQMLCRIKARA